MSMIIRGLRGVSGARALRSYHASPVAQRPYKDAQDRQTLKPRANEGTRSARDDDVTADKRTAFGKDVTSPEEARRSAAEGSGGLEASGANQELSKPQGDEGGKGWGAGKEVNKGGASGGGSGAKQGRGRGRG